MYIHFVSTVSGIGLCRRGILEAGRRLAEQGVILEAHHLCAATKGEALSLMGGDLSSHLGRSNQGLVEIPTPVELKRRIDYIANADPNLIPRALGVPPKQPDPMGLPPNIRRTMAALDTGLLRGIWDEGQANVDAAILESTDKVKVCYDASDCLHLCLHFFVLTDLPPLLFVLKGLGCIYGKH